MPQSLRSMLGLAQKAGQAASGEVAVEEALRKRRAYLLIVAEDASQRTRERLVELAAAASVPCYVVGTREELGRALGKGHRAAVAITSAPFANGITGILTREGLAPVAGRG
ncbi:MAG TPA: ribosomal L7Ae/L30e/S12e/Gadd45 family protein [Symbiobacteriaceae bacterium]